MVLLSAVVSLGCQISRAGPSSSTTGASPATGSSPGTPAASTAPAALVPASEASMGIVVGTNERAASSVVELRPAESDKEAATDVTPPPPAPTQAMDQVGQTFSPDMLFVRTGQPVEFRNSDDTLHNVHVTHTETKEPAFNVAIPTGEKFVYTFKRDGFYHVGCDIHPAMSADIFSSASPWVTMADSRGTFSFSDVPVGAYTIRIFSRQGTLSMDVEVKPGRNDLVLDEGSLKPPAS